MALMAPPIVLLLRLREPIPGIFETGRAEEEAATQSEAR